MYCNNQSSKTKIQLRDFPSLPDPLVFGFAVTYKIKITALNKSIDL